MMMALPSQRPGRRRFVAALLLWPAGCSGSLLADHLPTAVGGLPDDSPERPANPPAYPAVHDMPPPRATATLNDDQQKLLEGDLIAVRDRVGAAVAPPAAGPNGTSGSAKSPQ